MDQMNEFRTELEAAGLIPSEVVPDDVLRRCPTQDKPRSENGAYMLFQDGRGGWFQNHADGQGVRFWQAGGGEPDPETRRRMQERIEQEKREREAKEAEKHAQAAQEAQEYIKSLPDATDANPYLLKKGVQACPGLKADGALLIAPGYQENGKISTYQKIPEKGKKLFMEGGKAAGAYFPIRGDDAGALYVAESVSTGLSVHQAKGATVLCSFGAGNLRAVAEIARRRYPEREIIICGDDDHETEARTRENTGRLKAPAAARAVGGKVCFPVFKDPKGKSDFNDLHQAEGIEAVRRCLEAAMAPPAAVEADPWPEPVSFDSVETPAIDPEMVPEPLREFCEAVAVSVQVPFELPVMGALGAVATAAQGKFKVMVRPGYFEPLCIYSVTVLPPGERKSASLDHCKKPLVEWETEQYQLIEGEIKRARSELITRQKAIDKARGKAPSDPEKLQEVIRTVQTLEEMLPVVPVAPRLLCDDITPEAMASFMAEHEERASVIEAEGGLFSILAGMYSSGTPNLNLVLKSWSGESTTVDRRSRDTIRLRAPVLSLTLTPQNEVLRDIAKMPGFRGRGLLGRNIYCLPASRLGSRIIETVPMPEAVQANYSSMLFRILNKPWAQDDYGNRTPYQIRLSDPAYRLWIQFAEAVEVELRDGGQFEALRDWAGKLPGQSIRLAGLYHVAREEDPPSVPIPDDIMSMALSLAAVLADHARAAFGFMGSDPAIECARRVLRWIVQDHIETFTARDAYQAVKGSYPKMEQVTPGLRVLEDRVYIKPANEDSRTGPGRKPSPVFKVNPYSHNSHNSHNKDS
jgi:putative DNA primase/helicase